MMLIELVTLAAVMQYLYFGAMVGKARGQFGVKAPATTGHEGFERCYRVQMNTLEQLVAFLPLLWLSSRYWSPTIMGAIGVLFVVGRMIYARAYMKDPASRTIGFTLGFVSIAALIVASLVGMGMALAHA